MVRQGGGSSRGRGRGTGGRNPDPRILYSAGSRDGVSKKARRDGRGRGRGRGGFRGRGRGVGGSDSEGGATDHANGADERKRATIRGRGGKSKQIFTRRTKHKLNRKQRQKLREAIQRGDLPEGTTRLPGLPARKDDSGSEMDEGDEMERESADEDWATREDGMEADESEGEEDAEDAEVERIRAAAAAAAEAASARNKEKAQEAPRRKTALVKKRPPPTSAQDRVRSGGAVNRTFDEGKKRGAQKDSVDRSVDRKGNGAGEQAPECKQQ